MEEKKITVLQAYNAMRKFLEIFYEQTKSDDIGTILGETLFLPDGSTADPAAWEEWIESVEFALKNPEKEYISLKK